MDRVSYHAFTAELTDRLAARLEVLGLVAVGSMASGPDAYSDHDFLVIAEDEAAESVRQDTSWLPGSDRLVLHFRETAHGSKGVYDDGHLIEYAVFTLDEIALARLNRTRVLFDRADVADRIAAAVAATPSQVDAEAKPDEWLEGQFLTALLVGVQRHRRGEHTSALDFVHHVALSHLLTLLARRSPAQRPDARDDLNPFRRVELAYPAVGAQLAQLFGTGDLEEVARGLLELAARELRHVFDVESAGWQVVRRSIRRA
jgi:hypothetical protein